MDTGSPCLTYHKRSFSFSVTKLNTVCKERKRKRYHNDIDTVYTGLILKALSKTLADDLLLLLLLLLIIIIIIIIQRKYDLTFHMNRLQTFKFQTSFVVCFFFFFFFFFFCLFFFNYRLERRLYVKLKDWMSISVYLDETAHLEPSHLDLRCLHKPIIIACGSERVVNGFWL